LTVFSQTGLKKMKFEF